MTVRHTTISETVPTPTGREIVYLLGLSFSILNRGVLCPQSVYSKEQEHVEAEGFKLTSERVQGYFPE